MDNGKISFIVNGEDKGVAYESSDLKSGEYFITLNLCKKDDKIILAQA